MTAQGNPPSAVALLKCCKNVVQTQQVHARMIKDGVEQDHYVASHLLSLASRSISYSLFIFQRIYLPSTLLYNILLKACSRESAHCRVAVSLFVRMKVSFMAIPDKYTFPPLIKACSRSMKDGECIHASAIRYGLSDDVYVGTSFVDFYGKLMDVNAARRVFDEMNNKNLISLTSMIVAYMNVGDLENARILFVKTPERNVVTCNAMMAGLVREGFLADARKVFDEMPMRNLVSVTIMIDGYAKSGDMLSAISLFNESKEKDIVMLSALVNGYVQNGQPKEALEIFVRMVSLGIQPDKHLITSVLSACSAMGNLEMGNWLGSYIERKLVDVKQPYVTSALIDMYAKCGNLEKAEELFASLSTPDMIIYCSMIQGYSLHGKTDVGLMLFDRMIEEGTVPDEVAFFVVLMACSRSGDVDEGWKYFNMLKNQSSIAPTPGHYMCMVDLLCRRGRLQESYDILCNLPIELHVMSWGALLGACNLFDDIYLGEVVAKKLIVLQPKKPDRYVIMSNIYAASCRWLDVYKLRYEMKHKGILKPCGFSWLEHDQTTFKV